MNEDEATASARAVHAARSQLRSLSIAYVVMTSALSDTVKGLRQGRRGKRRAKQQLVADDRRNSNNVEKMKRNVTCLAVGRCGTIGSALSAL